VKLIPKYTLIFFLTGWAFLQAYASKPPLSGVVSIEHDPLPRWGGFELQRVGLNRRVAWDENDRPQNEPVIVVDPTDPDHLIGACNDYRTGSAACGWYVSFDGGESWSSGRVETVDRYGSAGDPSLAVDNEGRVYLCGINFDRRTRVGGIFVSIGEDGGRRWSEPSWVIDHQGEFEPPFEDKPWIAVDRSGGERDQALYVSWTRFGTGQIYFSRSLDRARSWSEPLRIYDGSGQGSLPVVGPDGELYLFWKDYSQDRILGCRSDDGGERFGDLFVVARTTALPDTLAPSRFRVWSIPAADVDGSPSPRRGRVVVAWADYRNGDADILMSYSDDGGGSWSEPQRLNDDDARNGHDQFFPWLSVDPTSGVVSAVWYDRRDDNDNHLIHLYGRRWRDRLDGTASERLSNAPFDPNHDFDGRFIGDYIGIDGLDGRAFAAWCDARDGGQDIYAARFDDEARFQVIEGERAHRFRIEGLSVNGRPAQPGDEIAVLDSLERVVGAYLVDGAPPYQFVATGDWVMSHLWRRIGGGYYRWKVWDQWEGVAIDVAAETIAGDLLLLPTGETTVRLEAPPPDTQRVHIVGRFNFLSFNVVPLTFDPLQVLAPMRNGAILVSLWNGTFWSPRFRYSSLDRHRIEDGYRITAVRDLPVTVVGKRIESQRPIQLQTWWNLIAYYPDYPLEVWDALESIEGVNWMAKDDRGRFAESRLGFSNMIPWRPGKGYLVRVPEAMELVYPREVRSERLEARVGGVNSEQGWTPSGGDNMSVMIMNIAGAEDGSEFELIAMTIDGVVCGVASLSGPPPWGMAVWEDDPSTPELDGAQSGEEITFQYVNRELNSRFEVTKRLIEGSAEYRRNELAVMELTFHRNAHNGLPDVQFAIEPNPTNGPAVVWWRLSIAGEVHIAVFDLTGRQVVAHRFAASNGDGQLTLPISGLSSGLYFVKLEVVFRNVGLVMPALKFRQIQRLVVLK